MPVLYVICRCYACGALMHCNPTWVPAIPANLTTTGAKEPVCRTCIEMANPKRKARGLPPIVIHPEAYEPEEA